MFNYVGIQLKTLVIFIRTFQSSKYAFFLIQLKSLLVLLLIFHQNITSYRNR